MYFDGDNDRKVQVSIHIGGRGDNNDPTVYVVPTNAVKYFTGDGEQVKLNNINSPVGEQGMAVTVYYNNTDAGAAHTGDCQVIIEEVIG